MWLFWFRNIPVGALDLTQTLVVGISMYVAALVYFCLLGYCYSRGRCNANRNEIEPVELIETTDDDDEN